MTMQMFFDDEPYSFEWTAGPTDLARYRMREVDMCVKARVANRGRHFTREHTLFSQDTWDAATGVIVGDCIETLPIGDSEFKLYHGSYKELPQPEVSGVKPRIRVLRKDIAS